MWSSSSPLPPLPLFIQQLCSCFPAPPSSMWHCYHTVASSSHCALLATQCDILATLHAACHNAVTSLLHCVVVATSYFSMITITLHGDLTYAIYVPWLTGFGPRSGHCCLTICRCFAVRTPMRRYNLERVIKMATNTNWSQYPAAVAANWSTKLAGAKPSNELLGVAGAFGRHGKQVLAIAMMLRDGGASVNQVKHMSAFFDGAFTGHFNKAKGLVEGGYFDRTGPGFVLTLTKKGQAFVKNVMGGNAPTLAAGAPKAKVEVEAPAKAKKAASKPRKAKVKAPAATVTTEVETVPPLNTDTPNDGAPLN